MGVDDETTDEVEVRVDAMLLRQLDTRKLVQMGCNERDISKLQYCIVRTERIST